MANKYTLSEATPANTDDALEGPLRIREIKQAYNERIGRDHLIGGVTSPDVIAQGADSNDSGYHRRITIREESTDQAATANTRLNASSTGINDSTTAKMAEVWVEKSSTTGNTTSIRFVGTESPTAPRTVVTLDQTQTLTNKTLTAPVLATVDINSGAIDGTTIGASSHSTGKFTTLEATGATTLGTTSTGGSPDIIGLKGKTSGLSETYGGANQVFSGLVGEIRMYGGSVAPEGWLFCDGSSITDAPDNKYSALIDVLAGSGPTSANLPDLRGKFPIGAGDDDSPDLTARALHATGGSEKLPAFTEANMPRHTHVLEFDQSTGAGKHNHIDGLTTETPNDQHYRWLLQKRADGGGTVASVDTDDPTDGVDEPSLTSTRALREVTHTMKYTGGSGSAEEASNGTQADYMPPFYVVTYIIKY